MKPPYTQQDFVPAMPRSAVRAFFHDLFAHAIAAASPAHCLPPFLHAIPAIPAAIGRTLVIGAGKAGASQERLQRDPERTDR